MSTVQKVYLIGSALIISFMIGVASVSEPGDNIAPVLGASIVWGLWSLSVGMYALGKNNRFK